MWAQSNFSPRPAVCDVETGADHRGAQRRRLRADWKPLLAGTSEASNAELAAGEGSGAVEEGEQLRVAELSTGATDSQVTGGREVAEGTEHVPHVHIPRVDVQAAVGEHAAVEGGRGSGRRGQ